MNYFLSLRRHLLAMALLAIFSGIGFADLSTFKNLKKVDPDTMKAVWAKYQDCLDKKDYQAALFYIHPENRKAFQTAGPEMVVFHSDSSKIIRCQIDENWGKIDYIDFTTDSVAIHQDSVSMYMVNDDNKYYVVMAWDILTMGWQRLETEHFRYIYNAGKDDDAVIYGMTKPNRLGTDYFDKQYRKISKMMGVNIPGKIDVYFANSIPEIRILSEDNTLKGQALSLPSAHKIFCMYPFSFAHEMAHIFEYEKSRQTQAQHPWNSESFLSEGFAEYCNGGTWKRLDCVAWMKKRLDEGQELSIRKIVSDYDSGIWDSPSVAALTKYLIEQHGEKKFLKLFISVRNDSVFGKYAQSIYGIPLDKMNADWLNWIKDYPADTSKQYITNDFKISTSEWDRRTRGRFTIHCDTKQPVPTDGAIDSVQSKYLAYCKNKGCAPYKNIDFYLANSNNRMRELAERGRYWWQGSIVIDTTFVNTKAFDAE